MGKIGLFMMCVLSVFISCNDDDDDHDHHHDDEPNWTYQQQLKQQENKICVSLEEARAYKNVY